MIPQQKSHLEKNRVVFFKMAETVEKNDRKNTERSPSLKPSGLLGGEGRLTAVSPNPDLWEGRTVHSPRY